MPSSPATALEGRLRAALKARGLELKRQLYSYSVYQSGERIAGSLCLDEVDKLARRHGYLPRGQRTRMAEARAALEAEGYRPRQGRGGFVVTDSSGKIIGHPLSLGQVETIVFSALSKHESTGGAHQVPRPGVG